MLSNQFKKLKVFRYYGVTLFKYFPAETRIPRRPCYFRDKTQTRSGKLQSHDERDHDRAKVNASKEVTAPVNCVKCAKRLIQRGPRGILPLVVYTTVDIDATRKKRNFKKYFAHSKFTDQAESEIVRE